MGQMFDRLLQEYLPEVFSHLVTFSYKYIFVNC